MRHSAGLLPFRLVASQDDDATDVEVFLVHLGGPFWARKDEGAWSLPKGEFVPGEEEPLDTAEREFLEEVGRPAPAGDRVPLGEARQSGKVVAAYALLVTGPLEWVSSNEIDIEWPPRSGRTLTIPEVDRGEWMSLARARERLVKGQRVFLDRLPLPPVG